MQVLEDRCMQTDVTLVIGEDRPKVFNKTLSHVPLCTCYSLFLENTLASDDSTVFIERDTQTIESGGICKDSDTQTSCKSPNFYVFIENVTSGTTENTIYYQNEYTQYHRSQDIHSSVSSNSYTQTLLSNSI